MIGVSLAFFLEVYSGSVVDVVAFVFAIIVFLVLNTVEIA
jgi:hypothetical protein